MSAILQTAAKHHRIHWQQLVIALAGFVATLMLMVIQVSANKGQQQKFEAKEAYVMDAKTGQVLYQKTATPSDPLPASPN